MDYCFVRRDDDIEFAMILVLKQFQSRAIQAWVVPNRSALLEKRVAAERAEGVRRIGHRDIVIVKTDNELAVLALRTFVLSILGIRAREVEPQPHESQSIGAIEKVFKIIKGVLRVNILAFERKLGHRVPSKPPLVA